MDRRRRTHLAAAIALLGIAFGLPFLEFGVSYLLSAATGMDSTPRLLVPRALSDGGQAGYVGAIRLATALAATALLLPGSDPEKPPRAWWVTAIVLVAFCFASALGLLAYSADFGCMFNPDEPWDCQRD